LLSITTPLHDHPGRHPLGGVACARGIGRLEVIPLQLSEFGSITLYWREDAVSRLAVATALNGIREVVGEFSPVT